MRFADLQAAYRPREKRVAVVLDGALLAEHEALSDQLAEAMAAKRTSLGDPGPQAIAERIEALEAALAASTVEITVTGLGRNAYRRLVREYTSADDESLDMDRFIPALLAETITDPSDVDVAWLVDHLSQGQVDDLFGAAFSACHESDRVPFNPLASAQTRG